MNFKIVIPIVFLAAIIYFLLSLGSSLREETHFPEDRVFVSVEDTDTDAQGELVFLETGFFNATLTVAGEPVSMSGNYKISRYGMDGDYGIGLDCDHDGVFETELRALDGASLVLLDLDGQCIRFHPRQD